MPLIEVTTNRQISASIRLEEVTATQVDQYATFIKASPDDVVDKALGYVFSKDRDFQDFLRTPEAQRITPTLRVRRTAVPDAVEQSSKKPAAGVVRFQNMPTMNTANSGTLKNENSVCR